MRDRLKECPVLRYSSHETLFLEVAAIRLHSGMELHNQCLLTNVDIYRTMIIRHNTYVHVRNKLSNPQYHK